MSVPAEQAILEESSDSQESQELYDAFMKYGIGMVCGVPRSSLTSPGPCFPSPIGQGCGLTNQ